MKYAILGAVALATVAHAADAAVVTYTNRATFQAAATQGGKTTQTETFTSSALDSYSAASPATYNRTFDGFSVTGQTNGNFIGVANQAYASPDTPIPATFNGQNFFSWQNKSGGVVSITINLNQATTAFGFDWFNSDVTDQYTFSVTAGGVTSSFSGPPFTVGGNSGFFGLTSDTAFTTATIVNNFFGGYISPEGFDNLTTNGVGSSNPTSGVPEPATWAMMLLGFGGMGYAMRRRSKVRTRIRFA